MVLGVRGWKEICIWEWGGGSVRCILLWFTGDGELPLLPDKRLHTKRGSELNHLAGMQYLVANHPVVCSESTGQE